MALSEVLDGFVTPGSLALDDEGRLYVADTGAKRVDLFTTSADNLPAFGDMVQASGHAGDPCAVAAKASGSTCSTATHAMCVFSSDAMIEVVAPASKRRVVFVVIDGAIYVGDPKRRRIAVWQRDQEGNYRTWATLPATKVRSQRSRPMAQAACWCRQAAAWRLSALRSTPAMRPKAGCGAMRSPSTRSARLEPPARRHRAPAGSHVQFFAFTGRSHGAATAPSRTATSSAPWRAVGSDVTDFFIDLDGASKQEALWLGARFDNDLHATPALAQLRVDFDQESYLPDLPAIYREPATATSCCAI